MPQQGVAPVALADQLSDVQLAAGSHLGGPRVAQVGVVGPHGDPARLAVAAEMAGERVQRAGHVAVAQVPALDAPAEHGAVVALRVDHEAGVLLREEGVVARLAALELDQLLHGLSLARLGAPDPRLVGVDLRIGAEVVEAGVALARAGGGLGGDLLEVVDGGLHRAVQAVEVQPVEAHLGLARGQGVIEVAQPPGELRDLGVAPHPDREAAEVLQGLLGGAVVRLCAYEAVEPVGVGPVGLHGYRSVAGLRYEALGDRGPFGVELVRAVGGLPEEGEAALRRSLDQRVVVLNCAGQGVQCVCQLHFRCSRPRRGRASLRSGCD
jgi:hypothetical protein